MLSVSSCFLLLLSRNAAAQSFTPVDRELSDRDVLELVDRSYPGLEAYSSALESGDTSRAHALLVAHFADRERPVLPPAEFPGIGAGNSTVVLRGSAADRQEADEKWLKHIFTIPNNDLGRTETFQLGPVIQWMESPSKALNWTGYLNQLNVVNKLAGVYRATGDEKYAREAGDMVLSWVRQVHRAYGYTLRGEYVPSGMEVRNRLCNCIAAYDVLRASESLTPAMHMAFWKLFITCCRELMEYRGVSFPGLIPAAVMLPEFREWHRWLESGREDLYGQLVQRSTPEGAWDTHSIAYQTVPVPWAARSLEFLRANPQGRDFTDIEDLVVKQAGKLLEMMLRVVMPNGGLPNIGDTYGRSDWSSGAANARLEPYIHLRMNREEQEHLRAIADPYARIKAALDIADGGEGHEPESASMAFPGTGYYVMRTGWEPNDPLYLYFDLSSQAMGHAHNDACHFELYRHGKPLLTDTGDYFLGWGYRTALHNCIEIDGQQQGRGPNALMEPVEWCSTPGFDLVDGIARTWPALGVRHRRKLVLIKPDVVLLCDILYGEGEHTAEQFFHFAGPSQQQGATAVIDPDSLAAQSTHDGVANVQILPADTAGLSASFAEARDTDMNPEEKFERAAMLGWIVTGGTFQRARSAVAVYSRRGAFPQTFHDILLPLPPDSAAQTAVRNFPVRQNGVEVGPSEAVCIELGVTLDTPAVPANEIVMELGENLAAGRKAFAEINTTNLPDDVAKITDGELGPRRIGAAVSSYPFTPGVELSGAFGVDFGAPVEVNTVVLHHGTWNGQKILYVPQKTTLQTWADGQWRDVPDVALSWGADMAATMTFPPITVQRLRARVARAAGGRLSMREFCAYRVSDAELDRVQVLREARALTRRTDTILVSHAPAALRTYGDFEFDGDLAVVRRDADGAITHLSVKNATVLRESGRELFAAAEPVAWLCATWTDDMIEVECPWRPVYRILSQGRRGVFLKGTAVATALKDGMLTDRARSGAPAPVISNARVELKAPQDGLAGAQPWALVTWTTDRPCTGQVEFVSESGVLRRTVPQENFVEHHSARVEFLIPGETPTFVVRSVSTWGRAATAVAAPHPDQQE